MSQNNEHEIPNKQSFIKKLNNHISPRRQQMAMMDDKELQDIILICNMKLEDVHEFLVKSLKWEQNYAIDLLKERGIKRITEAYDPDIHIIKGTQAKTRKPRSKVKMNKAQKIREKGVQILVDMGRTRADAIKHFNEKSGLVE